MHANAHFLSHRWYKISRLALFACSFLWFASIATPGYAQPIPPRSNIKAQALAMERDILNNFMQNGFDNNAELNNGLGGLWVNWVYGTNPLQTNMNGSGQPDGPSVNPPREDPLTDLRYLHNLWLYKSQNPLDTTYDSEIQKYTPIVQYEFATTNNERGWLYDEEFMDLYRLSQDPAYLDMAMSLIRGFAKAYKPAVGTIYKMNSDHPLGYYEVDHVLEAGCALVQAGTQFSNLTWLQDGQNIINFVYNHAYIAQYHTFPIQVDEVLTANGTANPNEVFYHDSSRNGAQMQPSNVSQIIISLLDTYSVTRNNTYLVKARDLLFPLSLPQNTLRLWDNTNLGYYYGVLFSGTGPRQPGSITVNTSKKEAGVQMPMLWAFHLADMFTGNMYSTMENLMLTVGLTKAYYTPGHGVLDTVRPDWSVRTTNHIALNWVTSEAMGATLEAIFVATASVQDPPLSKLPPRLKRH